MGGLLFAFALAAVAGTAVWLYRHEQTRRAQRDAERYVLARAQGWRYAREAAGDVDYRFGGEAGGVAWEMWFDSDRSTKSDSRRPRAVWRTSNLRSPQLSLLITDRRRYEIESGTLGRLAIGAVGALAGALAGRDVQFPRHDFYEHAIENEQARASIGERYAVLQSPQFPRGWLDDSLQSLLRQWPAQPARTARGDGLLEATLGPEGLRIEVRGTPDDAAFWRRLGELGIALSQRLARASSAG